MLQGQVLDPVGERIGRRTRHVVAEECTGPARPDPAGHGSGVVRQLGPFRQLQTGRVVALVVVESHDHQVGQGGPAAARVVAERLLDLAERKAVRS